jgi:hypothetical protein
VHGQKREIQLEGELKISYTKKGKTLIVICSLVTSQKYLIITSYYGN